MSSEAPSGVDASRPRRLILVGASGSGKTAIARRACEKLNGWSSVDTDDVIREQFGLRSIKEVFAQFGEGAFRSAEMQLSQELAAGPEFVVVATGGGLPANPGAMPYLIEAGLTIFLKASLDVLWRRINADDEKRRDLPMLEDGGVDRLAQLIDQRTPIYQTAHYMIDTDLLSLDEAVDSLRGIAERVFSRDGTR